MKMAPPSKSKTKQPDEDISQLRKPITLHGKPVEQILNSIHYGSPELRHLLLYECDMIFECKVCRALFRDLPNFISHKRRFCSKSAAELNHFDIGESPDERVIVVQPTAVDESEIARMRLSSPASSTCQNLEDTLQRIRTGEIGNSYAFQVYTNAAAKLRHQRDHARITSLRPREIPTNSNAVFVDVKSTSVNIHDRVKDGELDSSKPSHSSIQATSSSRRKVMAGKRRVGCISSVNNSDEKQLRSRTSNTSRTSSSSSKKCDELTDRLIKELKVIQNKVKNRTQENLKLIPGQCGKDMAKEKTDISSTEQKVNNTEFVDGEEEEGPVLNGHDSITENSRDGEILAKTRQNLSDTLSKKEKALNESIVQELSASPSHCSSDGEKDEAINKNDEERHMKFKRSLICSKCGEIFSSRKSLQFHFKTNHTVKRMFYPCPCCSNVYYYFSAVTRHLQRNHNKTNKEIDELRQMIRSKAFSKPSPSHNSTTAKVIKHAQTSSRRSLRYKDTFMNKKLGNAPFVYSSLNKGKKVSATKDPVLSVKNVEAEHTLPKCETLTSKNSRIAEDSKSTPDILTHLQPMDDNSNGPIRVLSVKRGMQLGKPKLFSDVGMQMQTCSKCLRLFGRQSTYEQHVKVCDNQSGHKSAVSVTADGEKKDNGGSVSNEKSPSIITRRKGREPKFVPSLQVTAVPILNDKDGGVADSRTKRNDRISNMDTNGGGEKCMSKTNVTGSTDCFHESDSTTNKVEKKISQALFQYKATPTNENNEQCQKPKNLSSNFIEEETSDTLDSWESLNLNDGKKELSDDAASCLSLEQQSNSVTRLKSREWMDAILDNKGSEKSSTTEDVLVVGEKSTIKDRPRRKRKVPNRSMEAVEILQKIHHSDDAGSGGKRMKCSEVDFDDLNSQTVSKQHGGEKPKGTMSNESCNVSKVKKRSSKIFISNNNRLECYNLSKVEKFMDTKNLKCLKCQSRFSCKATLKTHIVRSHLRWIRFQCKLCGFHCFHRSELSTHITRRHLKGKRPDKNRAINNLIIDLSKKGSEVMTLKKHETIKAKSRQQQKSGETDNIYRNQNAHKHPRLPEKKLSIASSLNFNTSPRKPQNEQKKSVVPSATKNEKASPSSSSAESSSEKDRNLSSRRVKQISHLVPRRPRLSGNISHDDNTNTPHMTPQSSFVQVPTQKTKSVNATLPISTSICSKLDSDDLATSSKIVSFSSSSTSVTSTSINNSLKKGALPFNISTRKSPRVFDTSPYNREETMAANLFSSVSEETKTLSYISANEVVMHTRNGAYTKTLPSIPFGVKEQRKPFSSVDKHSVNNTGGDSEDSGGHSELGEEKATQNVANDIAKDNVEFKSDVDDSNEIMDGIKKFSSLTVNCVDDALSVSKSGDGPNENVKKFEVDLGEDSSSEKINFG